MDFMTEYGKPGLMILLVLCVLYFVFRCVLLFFHFSKLKILSARRGTQSASREIADTEMMVMRDKRHVVSTAVFILIIIACRYGIDWYKKQGW